MSALIRVLRSPGVLLWVVVMQLIPAWLLGLAIRESVSNGMGSTALGRDRRILPGLIEILVDSGGFLSAFGVILPFVLLSILLLWFLCLGGVVLRLGQPANMSAMVAAGASSMPGLILATLWHLPVRLLLVVAPFALARKVLEGGAQTAAAVVIFGLFFFCTCVLDFARCRVILFRQKGWHPRTTLDSILDPVRQPVALAKSMVWSILQWACLLGVAWITLHKMGVDGAIFWSRLLAVVAVFFGLVRLAVAVEASGSNLEAEVAASRVEESEASPETWASEADDGGQGVEERGAEEQGAEEQGAEEQGAEAGDPESGESEPEGLKSEVSEPNAPESNVSESEDKDLNTAERDEDPQQKEMGI